MVRAHYRTINTYLRELQLHPAVEYLLACFVVPSSVVLVWSQVSAAIRDEGELKEVERSGCEMSGGMGISRVDLNSVDIEWSGGDTGQLIPCFCLQPLQANEFWVITSLAPPEEKPEEDLNDVVLGKPGHRSLDLSTISRCGKHWTSLESESVSEANDTQGHMRSRSVLEEGTRPIRYY